MMHDAIAQQIRKTFNALWAEDHAEAPPALEPETILLETGFDSMAFAVLVAQLDEDIGVDPFALELDAETPVTFADFVGFYERCLACTPEASERFLSTQQGSDAEPEAATALASA